MEKEFEKALLQFTKNRSTISIDELEQLLPNLNCYEEFAILILNLENAGVLDMVKSHGRNNHNPSLAYKYRIHRHALNRMYYQELQTYRLKLHQAINLDIYFNLDYTTWSKDLPYLKAIDSYIKTYGFPVEKVPAPERSFELVGDEKWIEQGGSDLLQRIQLVDEMKIFPVSDPLMFAVNPTRISTHDHFHLIVENKTTYQAMLPVINKTIFSTLIYGSGNKIPKSIENFYDQFPVDGHHMFFYFGDIDHSGISIWYSLNERQLTVPAIPFYKACLLKDKAYGKTNQRKDKAAIETFCEFFQPATSNRIKALLNEGAYLPQEVLKTKELQQIWLEADWEHLKNIYEFTRED